MMGIARALRIMVLLSLTVLTIRAQNAVYLQGLFVGSDGTAKKEAPGAEEGLEAFHNEFLQAMGLRSRGNTVLALSSIAEKSAHDRIAALLVSTDSNDVAVVVALGAWEKDSKRVELSALSSIHPDRMTLDYLLNLILFLPVRTMSVFVLAPPRYQFPLDMFREQRPGIGGGGKYLVVIQPKGQSDYEAAVDDLHDLLEKTGDGGSGDRNKDGMLSFTEWMMLFERLSTPEFTVLSYRITESPDIQLKQLH